MAKSNTFGPSHFLFICKRRLQGWEEGLLHFPESLYGQMSILVKNLELLPENSQCWFETTSSGTVYYADGIEIGKLTDPR
jgi:hypothetical protein